MTGDRVTTGTPARILDPAYRWTTIGSFSLIFLAAFESLAVTTIMPAVSRDLDGEALYAVAFSATVAASVIGMVVAAQWADRRGPAAPLLTATVVFLLGLMLSGTSTAMEVFVAGRFLQGLGSGAIIVALYVVVARLYPSALHPRIFGSFAAAWVVPSMVGPAIAGSVADASSWHWVFLGVCVLVLAAGGLLVPAVRAMARMPAPEHDDAEAPSGRARGPVAILLAVVVAAAVLGINVGGELPGWWGWAAAAVAVAIVLLAIRPLLPVGALRFARGLPATVMLRCVVAAAFLSTEIYLPYYLQERHGFTSAMAGLILTVGSVSWAAGSEIQGRLGDRLSHRAATRAGALLVGAGVAVQLVAVTVDAHPAVSAVGWLIAGGGMGVVFPRLSTLVIAWSTTRTQGFNSAALTIADSAGAATATAVSGLVFALAGGVTGQYSFAAVLLLTTAIAFLAYPVARRITTPG